MDATLVSPLFVGRHSELASMSEARARAVAGEPGFVLICGEAGVGKSRLVEETSRAAHGMRVLTGRCMPLGAEALPFAPLVDALRDLARSTSAEELAALLGPARSQLSRLLPDLDPDAAGGAPAAGDGAHLFGAVLGLLERLGAAYPVLLIIEDLHWADTATLDLTAFLVRALRDVPVLVVMTYRTDELTRRHPLRPLLTSWDRLRSVKRLDLARFDHDEVAAQLDAILTTSAEPTLVDVVYERSEGNPFLVEELIGVVQAGGDPARLPPSLRDVLLTRVDALSPVAQQLLRTAAVAGRWVPEALLVAVSGLAESVVFDALRETVEHCLLVVDDSGRGYSFRHALGRDAVYDDMLPGERVRIHAAYGEALTQHPELGGDDAAAVAAALAHHWYAALDLPRALDASVQAARYAANGYAPAAALRHLERALEIWPRVPDAAQCAGMDQIDVLHAAAEAAYGMGAIDRTLSLLDQALVELGADDPARLAALIELKAQSLRDLGRDDDGVAVLEAALASLPAEPPMLGHATLRASLATALTRRTDMSGSRDMAASAVAAAIAVGATRQEAEARITLGSALAYLEEPEAGLRELRHGIELAQRDDSFNTVLRGYINLSDALQLLGRDDEAATTAGIGLDLARRVGLTRTFGSYLTGNLVETLINTGRWAQAEDLMATATLEQPEGIFAATLIEVGAHLAALTGRLDDAEKSVRIAREFIAAQIDNQFSQPLAFTAAEVARGRGELPAAELIVSGALGEDGQSWVARYAWPLVWAAERIQAEIAIAAADRRQPAPPPLPDAVADLVDTLPATTAPERAYRSLAQAERSRVDAPADPTPWVNAVEAWRLAARPYHLAYALLRLAEADCAAGRRVEATAAAREAAALARELGASPLVLEVEAIGRRARLDIGAPDDAGDPIRSDVEEAAAGPDELARFHLTEREREVLGMVATGQSNQQIAEALFISRKTASVHVSNIMAKLDVTSRVAAAALVHRLGASGLRQESPEI